MTTTTCSPLLALLAVTFTCLVIGNGDGTPTRHHPQAMQLDAAARDLTLRLTKVSQRESPLARCLDGSPPAYYWRDGHGADMYRAVLFLEGGGWCYPSDVQQTTNANCARRAKTGGGSSKGYPATIASTGYQGGSGFLSGDPIRTKWANWAVGYIKYCDGGSMTGTRKDPMPARNGSGSPLYYRGHYNIIAQLDSMVATKGLGNMKEIVLSGCSAGGMACYLKCDFVAAYFASHEVPVKCICDAGIFLDVDTITGAGNVMQTRYHDIADIMESKPGLSTACVGNETDWRQCMFSQYSLKYMQTPTFVINSLYNFAEWTMLAPIYNSAGEFPPDTSIPPPDWRKCYPQNGQLSPATYRHCNTTQKKLIQGFRLQFIEAISRAIDPSSPHGAFLDSCPNQHCQTSTGWSLVRVNNTTMADAAARWYFEGSSSKKEKHVDDPFPTNPTCGYTDPGAAHAVDPLCYNCGKPFAPWHSLSSAIPTPFVDHANGGNIQRRRRRRRRLSGP